MVHFLEFHGYLGTGWCQNLKMCVHQFLFHQRILNLKLSPFLEKMACFSSRNVPGPHYDKELTKIEKLNPPLSITLCLSSFLHSFEIVNVQVQGGYQIWLSVEFVSNFCPNVAFSKNIWILTNLISLVTLKKRLSLTSLLCLTNAS